LYDKVLERIADKNTFIGICTRNERVIADASLRSTFFRRNIVQSEKDKFGWKASDWIIQELGLAIGRGLDLLLLVENGVRQPGGLQGNLEYITFDRDAPEQCFPKILEMLSALSPKAKGQLPVVADATSTGEQEVRIDDAVLATPDETWSRDRFERALYVAIQDNDESRIKLLDDQYRRSSNYSEDDNSVTWQANIEYFRILVGKGGQQKRLKTLADSNPSNEKTLVFLARSYDQFGQSEQAAETFLQAMKAAKTPESEAEHARDAVRQFHFAKNRKGVDATLAILRQLSLKTPSLEPLLTEATQVIAEGDKDEKFVIALLERRMELAPDDHRTRFTLALKQSAIGNEAIALHHYLRIPHGERGAATLNNIGVSAEALLLQATAVGFYQRAAELGETLAMSNLGNKLGCWFPRFS
jgi:thioredoxin-like negative regulator of GroEL